MPDELVRIEKVWVHYGDVPVLEDINLSVQQGDFLGIIGPNGGGKTTLLRVILGLIRPTRGKVSVLGGSPRKARNFVGYVPQYSLFHREFPASVWDVVLMGRCGYRGVFQRYNDKDRRLALHALETVEMSGFRNRQIGRLSGGELQRVFIARALVLEPKLLLLDEPTASVDTAMQTEFYQILDRLRQNMAIMLVSHDIGAVSVYVDKIACLNRRLFYHDSKEISAEELKAVYGCPVDLIAHGVPHRVFKEH